MQKQIARSSVLAMFAIVGSSLSPVIGAPFLLPLFRGLGVLGFVLIIGGLGLIQWGLSQPLMGINLVVTGVFVLTLLLFLKSKISTFWSAFFASLAGVLGYGVFFGVWSLKFGTEWLNASQTRFVELFQNFEKMGLLGNKATQTTAEIKAAETVLVDLFYQTPSALFVMFGVAAALCILAFKRFEKAEAPRPLGLKAFRVPIGFVWGVAIALFASFYNGMPYPVKMVGLNLLNVMILLYFFQGLAVFFHWLVLLKINGVLRIFLLVIFCFQFFLFLSLLGFFDIWLEFRKRKQSKRSKV
jgi:hypothetical protein